MNYDRDLLPAIFDGWHSFHNLLVKTIAPLDMEQLSLSTSHDLRSIREISAHIIGARARWFYLLMGEGGPEFEVFGRWDRPGMEIWRAEQLVSGLDATWIGMNEAMDRWTPEDWQKSWPGEDDSEPKLITRQWVIWHLIEHDLYHGGEISITLGTHGVPALEL